MNITCDLINMNSYWWNILLCETLALATQLQFTGNTYLSQQDYGHSTLSAQLCVHKEQTMNFTWQELIWNPCKYF